MGGHNAREFRKGAACARLFPLYWLVFALFYWWLIAKVQIQQLAAAVLVGAVVAIGLTALHASAGLRLSLELGWFGLLVRRLPGKILSDLLLLAKALVRAASGRQSTGTFKEVPFVPGGEDPQSAARRALVTAAISVPPNTIALSVQSRKRVIKVHQLVFKAEPPGEKEWPL